MAMRMIAIAGLLLVLAGCRTDKEILNDYEANLRVGNYAQAAVEVTEKAESDATSRQMWRLLAASANYLADDKVAAVAQFDKAEEVFRANDARGGVATTAQGAWALLTNDKALAYDGGGLDREYTCLYRSIDFMTSGDFDSARVELNRLTQYQTNWLVDRRKEIESAQKQLEAEASSYERSKGSSVAANGRTAAVNKALADASFAGRIKAATGFDPATSGNLAQLSQADYMSVYGLHLTGLFRWLNEDSDRNELRDAARFASRHPVAVRDAAERARPGRPRNQVWVYVEDGLCPCREEFRLDLPLIFIPGVRDYAPYVGMALPQLRERERSVGSWSVGGRAMQPLEDVDRLVRVEYEVAFRGALVREITRTLAKAGVQIALGVLYDNAKNEGDQLKYRLAQYAVAVWAASTTGADLRSWTALPKTVYLQRLDRPADGRIQILGDGLVQVEAVVPPGNSIIFVRKPAAGARPVVKVATFK